MGGDSICHQSQRKELAERKEGSRIIRQGGRTLHTLPARKVERQKVKAELKLDVNSLKQKGKSEEEENRKGSPILREGVRLTVG